MTIEEFKLQIQEDKYLIGRKDPTEAQLRLYLKEVNFHCPLCGKVLQSKKQKKESQKKFEIAHIYPNKPTYEQYSELNGLERLGINCESIENKIALCTTCHKEQDHHTTKDEYLRLLNIKKSLINQIDIREILDQMQVEDDIKEIINKLSKVEDFEIVELKYDPVEIKNKIRDDFPLLKRKVKHNVTDFYPFIFEEFKKNDNKNNTNNYEVICSQIKAAYIKIKNMSDDQSAIFNMMVAWLMNKTLELKNEACEIVISYFIQNCEVFDEITK